MSDELENRRFRTWESDTPFDPSRSWLVVLKYGWIRMRSTWYVLAIFILAILSSVISLGINIMQQSAEGMGYWSLLSQLYTTLGWSVLLILVVGSPMFAEDTRFNAPLFYYSKPLSAWDYYRAKFGMLFGFSMLIGVVPIILLALLTMVVNPSQMPADYYQNHYWGFGCNSEAECLARAEHQWRVEHMNSFADGLYLLVVAVPAAFVSLAFLSSLFGVMSAYVDRAWHAAIGAVIFVAGLSTLGAFASEGVDDATFFLYGPAQWLQAINFLPLESRFSTNANPYIASEAWRPEQYQNLGLTVVLSYIFLVSCTVLFMRLTLKRLEKLEEAA